jgi:thymidylate synthase (FAD)
LVSSRNGFRLFGNRNHTRYCAPNSETSFVFFPGIFPALCFEHREARIQDAKNRQNSIEIEDEIMQENWSMVQDRVAKNAETAYKWAIENGIAKEQARAVLPEGMTVSRLYMNGTLRSWVHYIQLRSGNGTQKEHREVALKCAEAIAPIFPMIMEFVSKSST